MSLINSLFIERDSDSNLVSGNDGEEVTPVPIPNTEVKLFSADGTWLETARESRTLPEQRKSSLQMQRAFVVDS